MLRNDQVDALPKLLPQWADCGVDALIAGDLGALRIIKRLLPDMPVHISVQTGLANYEAVRAMADFGACRAILSRELVLDEIATIRAKTPGCIELEAFVHGSMCVSVSGRCLLSDYMTMQQSIPPHNDDNAGAKTVPGVDDKEKGSDDDASLVDGLFTGLSVDKSVCTDRQMVTDDENALNSGLPLADLNTHFIVHDKAACPPDDTAQAAIASPLSCRSGNGGDCAQPCRWKYALMEEKRPGEYYPVYETQEGSFLLNSKDLCMISHLSDMAEAGVTSLKIEGRAKSAYYAAVTANAYRCALDEWRERGYPHAFSPSHWMVEELDKVSHRPYSTGFYLGGRGGQHTAGGGYVRDYEVMGVVIDSVPGRVHVSQRNKLYTGDRVELLEPGRPPIACTVSDLF